MLQHRINEMEITGASETLGNEKTLTEMNKILQVALAGR